MQSTTERPYRQDIHIQVILSYLLGDTMIRVGTPPPRTEKTQKHDKSPYKTVDILIQTPNIPQYPFPLWFSLCSWTLFSLTLKWVVVAAFCPQVTHGPKKHEMKLANQ